MASKKLAMPSIGAWGWLALGVGGVLATAAAPKLLPMARRTARRATGATYRTGGGTMATSVDPRRGRAA